MPDFDPELVRNVSEAFYRERLGESAVKGMIEADADKGEKLRTRAGSYDPLTRIYLGVILNKAQFQATR